ncbi:O-antigen ligase family protein [Sphingomonas desiccabilis]|nr:O-antigen ligase family protein [Sphingomonas desiccabilis]MBB3910001.1 O-antigen ligase [Sphingomonas desiccabilis]
MALQLMGLGALLFAFVRRDRVPDGPIGRVVLILLVLAAALPLLYTVPLPPSIWTALPGREEAVKTYQAASIPLPWHAAGLRAGTGIAAALYLLAPAAVLFATVRATETQRWNLVYILLALVAVSVFLGLAQAALGNRNTIKVYGTSSINGALGFFANRNHLATLLLCAIPLAAACSIRWSRGREPIERMAAIAGAVLIGLAILGIAATTARAGLVLILPMIVGAMALFVRFRKLTLSESDSRDEDRAAGRWMLPVGLGLALILGLALALHSFGAALTGRVQSQGLVDAGRLGFYKVTGEAIEQYLPIGSGPTTFTQVYAMREPVEQVASTFVNHAHNDYYEIALEYGVFGVILVAVFLAWFLWAAATAWLGRANSPSLLGSAASVAILAVLLHSLGDYPLRTTTMACVFALLCGLLVPAPRRVRRTSDAASQQRMRRRVAAP